MKKIFLYTIVLISIPFFIVMFYNNQFKEEKIEEIKLNYISNIVVRVMRSNTQTIENINLEEYIEGVVAGEMPALFEIEALKAQAVASRSYVLKKMEDNKEKDYDVIDTVANQVYLDENKLKENWQDKYTEYINRVRTAVNETSMEYLEYQGQVINAMFFSTSNGYTEDASLVFKEEIPYLKSVESSWDSEVSSAFKYSTQFSLQEFYEKLNIPYTKTINIDIKERSASNRILLLTINDISFTGRDLYNKLGLRSTDFTITQVGSNVIIDTVGYGHGVGMSQYGAQGMAKAGYTYDLILKHYYTDTDIVKLK